MNTRISSIIDGRSGGTGDLLSRLIAFRSTVGSEREAQEYLAEYAKGLGIEARLVPIQPDIESDEDYTTVPGHKGYQGRANLILAMPGAGGGRSIILNSHIDVVPGPDELFVPQMKDGVIKGRGAVDAKGQCVVILWRRCLVCRQPVMSHAVEKRGQGPCLHY